MRIEESQIPDLIKQGRDKEAIDLLYKNILPVVKKYVTRNSGTPDDAEDLFQEAVVSFYQSVMTGKFNSKYTVYGFVYKICLYRWINKERRDKKVAYKSDLEQGFEETFSDIAVVEEEIEDEPSIFKRLMTPLGDKCKELLNYAIIKDMLIEDIQIRMNFPSKTAVSMQIGRCKDKLMGELEKNPAILNKLKGL